MKIDCVQVPVWVAWTNTDKTEGRGQEYPLVVAESMETACRLGKGEGVQGCDCRVTEEFAMRVNGMLYVPGDITPESDQDRRNREIRQRKEAAIKKAKALGLSENDLKDITG